MNSQLDTIMLLTNQEIDQQIELFAKNIPSHTSVFSPTTDFLLGSKLIEKENIVVKQNDSKLFCIPVFEYHGNTYGILESSSYLRTAMMYYLAKKLGIIKEG